MAYRTTWGENKLDLFFTSNETLINKIQTWPLLLSEADHDSGNPNISTKARINKDGEIFYYIIK